MGFFHAAFAQPYAIEQVSENPKIFNVSNFLSEEECDYLISYAKSKMSRSTVFDETTEQRKVDRIRTSTSMRFSDEHGDEIIQQIEQRISEITSLAESQGENIQIAHYETGAQYAPHYDYFKNTASQEGGQRIATFLMYLNTPIAGGETRFPRAKLLITPIKGNALFFYNVDEKGAVNSLTLHAGNEVLDGEK